MRKWSEIEYWELLVDLWTDKTCRSSSASDTSMRFFAKTWRRETVIITRIKPWKILFPPPLSLNLALLQVPLLFDTKKLSQSGDEVSICVQKWIRAPESEVAFVATTLGTWVIDESYRLLFRRKLDEMEQMQERGWGKKPWNIWIPKRFAGFTHS